MANRGSGIAAPAAIRYSLFACSYSPLAVCFASFSRLHHRVQEAAGLAAPERSIMPIMPQQLLVRPLLDDTAMVEHDQPIHARDGGEPVGNGDDRLAGHQGAQARLNGGLDLAVERGGR